MAFVSTAYIKPGGPYRAICDFSADFEMDLIHTEYLYEGFWERRSILFCALDKCIEMVGIRMISTLVEIRSPSWVNCHRPVILNDFQTFQIPDGGLFHLAGVTKRKRPGVD